MDTSFGLRFDYSKDYFESTTVVADDDDDWRSNARPIL